MTNLGAHTIDQVLWLMDVKGPTMVMSTGGRYALEDDGETPDLQDALWVFPGFTMNYAIREANAMRGDPAARGQLYCGTKGTLMLAGGYEVTPENKIDPVNDIPRFSGQPVGGPVYTDVKPTPWIQASKGGVESDARYGTGGEDTMADERAGLAEFHANPQAPAVRGGRWPPRVRRLPPGQYVSPARPRCPLGSREGAGNRR